MQQQRDLRVAALARFAIAISVFTTFGHFLLGFEPPYAAVPVALATGYSLDLVLETIHAWIDHRKPAYRGGGFKGFVIFLLPSHITGLACAMLLYTSNRLLPVMFAVAIAIGSKSIFRVKLGKGKRHFLNPSNTGIAFTMLVFAWITPTPPYQFTENLTGGWDWFVPGLIICTGSILNIFFTKKLPLIAGWLIGFASQALFRIFVLGLPSFTPLGVMTGVAFVLFTFYMVPDPGTTPVKPLPQFAFGASVGLLYGVFIINHITFGMFYALVIVCTVRGLYIFAQSLREQPAPVVVKDLPAPAHAPAPRAPALPVPEPVASQATLRTGGPL
jgi:hypothetical protein